MAIPLGQHKHWTKSSHSVNNACVVVRSVDPAVVGIADSKVEDSPARPALAVSPAAFAALTAHAATLA